jgi:hypothetical protein
MQSRSPFVFMTASMAPLGTDRAAALDLEEGEAPPDVRAHGRLPHPLDAGEPDMKQQKGENPKSRDPPQPIGPIMQIAPASSMEADIVAV